MEPEVLGSRPRGGTIAISLDDNEIDELRADTPGCAHLAHYNNAGASLSPRAVIDEVTAHLELEQRVGGYRAQRMRGERLDEGYAIVARLLGVEADEIGFCQNASRGWELCVHALPWTGDERVAVHGTEYSSNWMSWQVLLGRHGFALTLTDDFTGADVVSVGHIPSDRAEILPVAAMGRRLEATYIVDTCQSVGRLPLDLGAWGVDIACGTARKYLRGPRGAGFLYMQKGLQAKTDPVFPDLRSAELVEQNVRYVGTARRFETWEHNVAARLGMLRAIEIALDIGLNRIAATVAERTGELNVALRKVGMAVEGDGSDGSGHVMFSHPRHAPEAVMARLAERDVNISVSERWCGEPRRLCRASVHVFNDGSDLQRIIEGVGDL